MLACTALVGCTNEDVISNPENNNPALNGEKTYLAVKLINPEGAASRGEGDTNNPFWYATADENKVAQLISISSKMVNL